MRQCPGYMLLEIMLWCALVGMGGAVISSIIGWYDHTCVRNEVHALYHTLIAHTFRACAEDRVCDIVFHERGWSSDTIDHVLDELVQFGALPASKGPPAAPAYFIADPVTFAQHTIRLYPDGKARPGTVYFTDQRMSSGYALSCPVGKISYIRRYRFHAGKWIQML